MNGKKESCGLQQRPHQDAGHSLDRLQSRPMSLVFLVTCASQRPLRSIKEQTEMNKRKLLCLALRELTFGTENPVLKICLLPALCVIWGQFLSISVDCKTVCFQKCSMRKCAWSRMETVWNSKIPFPRVFSSGCYPCSYEHGPS